MAGELHIQDNETVDDLIPVSMNDIYWSLFVDEAKQSIKKPTLDSKAKGLFEDSVPTLADGHSRVRAQFIWWNDPTMNGDKIRLWIRVVGYAFETVSPPFRILADDAVDGDRVGDLLNYAQGTREMGHEVASRAVEVQEERNHKSGDKNLIDRAVESAEMRQTIARSISHYGPLTAGRSAGTQRDSDRLRDGRKTYNG